MRQPAQWSGVLPLPTQRFEGKETMLHNVAKQGSQMMTSLTQRRFRPFVRFALMITLCAALSGCGESLSPEMLAIRSRLLTKDLTSASTTRQEEPIMTIREQLKSGQKKAGDVVLVRARVNAGDMSPFAEGLASVTLTDATGHDGDESHNPHECPFCKRDILEMMAILEFRGSDGQIIPEDTRKLLDLREFDLVLVEGTLSTADDGMLRIQGSRLEVLR